MVFSIPSYLCLGDRPRAVQDERGRGLNFVVSYPKSGKGNDAYMDQGDITNKYLWAGERLADAETTRRREQLASDKKNLTPNGFAYVGPSKKGEGLGSYFGCFQTTPYTHVADHPEKQADLIAEIREKKRLAQAGGEDAGTSSTRRGIYTSPAKKGCGYGYAGLALSDIGCNYIASFYEQSRRRAAEDKEVGKSIVPEPFKPSGRSGYTFDESKLTGVSRCYTMTVPFQEKRPEKEFTHFRVSAVPWRPAGAVESGPARIDYWEDPYKGYDPRLEPKAYVKKPSDEVFRPSSCSDTFWYTQSIVFKRI